MPKTKNNETITIQVDKNEISSDTTAQTAEAVSSPSSPAVEKPKCTSRKKKVETEATASSETATENKAGYPLAESNGEFSRKRILSRFLDASDTE